MKNITAEELKKMIISKNDIYILDVRENWEFDEGHIKGAKNFSLYSIPNSSDELKDWQNKAVIVHCKSGNRSQKAQILLINEGFSNVKNLIGGYDAWKSN